MSEIRVDSEKELVEEIQSSRVYEEFKSKQLQPKREREAKAWKLLEQHRGKYSIEYLNQIFDSVDLFEGGKHWFGSLLSTPNRNLIFESAPELINQWIEQLLFSKNDSESALNICLKNLKIKGASKGLATLLLYLSAPNKYNIWVNATQQGLQVLERISELRGNDWGENYSRFNKAAVEFRDRYVFQSQEIDWVLSFITHNVESQDGHFRIGEELLEADKAQIAVDDEPDIEDIVGEPMELRVMRWAPTNEMGVVALFIEFRKELGFPIVEVIRSGFPDAAVFENSPKGYVRRYIEFELRSSGYKSHMKSKRKCDYVVCWQHDWKDCPIPVRELQREIPAILAKKNV